MKTILAAGAIALTAAVIPMPASAEIGCQWGDSWSNVTASNCWRPAGAMMATRAPAAYAFVPQRQVIITQPRMSSFAYHPGPLVDIDEEVTVRGGSLE